MTANLTILFLIAHILADYYLQLAVPSEAPSGRYKDVLLQSCIYIVPFGLILAFQHDLALPIGVVVVSHFLIGSGRYVIEKHAGNRRGRILYASNQLLQLVIIFLATGSAGAPRATSPISAISPSCLQWALLLIIIMKPVNVTFKKMFAGFQPTRSETTATLQHSRQTSDDLVEPVDGAGAIIGNLERIIAAIFISSGQYAAIGLIFTAKSIARYNKIAEDQAFAEYYLIGSLFSVLSVMVCYWIVFSIL